MIRTGREERLMIMITKGLGPLGWSRLGGSAIIRGGDLRDINDRINIRWGAYLVTEAMKKAG